jgi:peptide/nickel transport system substrate-binding protein
LKDTDRGGARSSRKRLGARLTVALLAVPLLFSACGGGGVENAPANNAQPPSTGRGSTEDEGTPAAGGSISVGVESETNTFLPSRYQGSQAGFNVATTVYDPLMTTDNEGKVVPYLAESMVSNADYTMWTLKLRPGIKFHDGTPLNSAALKEDMDKYLKADGAITAGNLRDMQQMDIVDDLTVNYVMTRPNAGLPDLLQGASGWPFSPTAAANNPDFGSAPVGTGAFKVVSWQRDGAFVVEKNPDYWQKGLPYLDKITFRPIPDEETRAASMASREIEATQSVRLSTFLAKVRSQDGVKVNLGLGNGGGGTMFNVEKPPVDDVRIRQAMALGVKQQDVIDVVAGDSADATELRTQFYAKNSPYYSQKVADSWPKYDPDKAKKLVQEYKNDPKRSDGQPAGSPVALQYGCTNTPSLQEQAQAFVAFWKEIGIDVENLPKEQSVHIGEAIQGNYQVKCFRAGSDIDPFIYLQGFFGDPKTFPGNLTNYNNATVNEVIDALRTTPDVAKRAVAIEKLGLKLDEDIPWIWTGSDLGFIAAQTPVKGIATWKLPDGTLGDGAQNGITFWSKVWVKK